MDTSETYIKMCEKAEEIQGIGDKYWDKFSIGCWHSPNHVRCKGHFEYWHMAYKYCPVCGKQLEITPEYSICSRREGDDNIWLPRQDQLQAMYGNMSDCLSAIYRWEETSSIGDYYCYDYDLFTSLEQLWLAFVMKEKYNKTWNGEEWIK